MRIEIERKKLVTANSDPVRVCELACLMTLCNMESAHKFLAFKNAFISGIVPSIELYTDT